MTCYDAADAVVAMPPSRPDKPFDLPRYLAERIATEREKADLSGHVVTWKRRPPLKDVPLAKKIEAIQGTITVDGGPFQDRTVLLVDDLYQSGISMNYVAMELLRAGARAVLGLACEKTCRNDDNVSHSRD
jgi:predicted amidophosphoribosyltransferase